MARRRHEEHQNHEAWAIPYGDLLTLLLAFFVVMYSISSVNEGKYRVLSDAMAVAFGSTPKSMKPIQIGTRLAHGTGQPDTKIQLPGLHPPEQSIGGTMRDLQNPAVVPSPEKRDLPVQQINPSGATGYAERQLDEMNRQIDKVMGGLIGRKMVEIKRGKNTLEVEIHSDILFASGQAGIAPSAKPVLDRLAAILRAFPNPLRVEGHTDDIPIHTEAFPSNWELSAARAASVVHLFMDEGISGTRMSVAGFGEYQPVAGNDTAEGRNRNRRVSVVVLTPEGADVPAALDSDDNGTQHAPSNGTPPSATGAVPGALGGGTAQDAGQAAAAQTGTGPAASPDADTNSGGEAR